MRRFTAAELEALFAAVLENDVVDAEVALPAAVSLDVPPGRLAEGFAVSRALWEAGAARETLADLAAKLQRDRDLDEADRIAFKHARARYKHLRFACVLYGADHRCPPVLKASVTLMGRLQDAYRTGRRAAAGREAVALRLMLSRVPRALAAWELDRLRPSGSEGFRRWTLAQTDGLRALLAQETVTGDGFHAARKIVSRRVSFHDDMRVIHPAPEHVLLSRHLSAINGLMGAFHDRLVEGAVPGMRDYHRDRFPLPPDIRRRLEAFTAVRSDGR